MRKYDMDGVSQAYKYLMLSLELAAENCEDAIDAIDEAPPGFYDPVAIKVWKRRAEQMKMMKRAIEGGEL